jgi:hypothetical protein
MQFKNQEHNDNQVDEFVRRNEFHHDGARLADVMAWANRGAGGALMWGFTAQSTQNLGAGGGSPYNVVGGIDFSNYSATANGGPYATLDGIGEYYWRSDASWQESGTLNFLVWFWTYSTDLTSGGMIAAKWDVFGGANDRSWRIYLTTNDVFGFDCNPTGLAAAELTVESTLALSANTWYFVAGFLQPSTLQSLGVAAADDTVLTYTAATTGVPNGVHDGASALYIGAMRDAGAVSNFWAGRMGVGLARANVPATNIRSHAARIFSATRWFYQ